MESQLRQDTACELRLRRALFAEGLRYRVHRRVLDGLRRAADVVFIGARVVVFVDGCFWHGCRIHKQPVKSNAAWWAAKFRRTRARDRDTDRRLQAAGWSVVRVWEHVDSERAARRIVDIVGRRPRRALRVVL